MNIKTHQELFTFAIGKAVSVIWERSSNITGECLELYNWAYSYAHKNNLLIPSLEVFSLEPEDIA